MKGDEEFKSTLRIYKIGGIIIAALFLFGIIYAVVTREKAPEQPIIPVVPAAQPTSVPPEPTAEIIIQNITNQTLQNISNATANASAQENITVPTAKPVGPAVLNVSWATVNITFPATLKRESSLYTAYEYIEIMEADGTPITNGEQFDISFILDDHKGHKGELVANYEKQKWLISLMLPNKGSYTLTVKIVCKDQQGYCLRLYGKGSAQKSIDFDVV